MDPLWGRHVAGKKNSCGTCLFVNKPHDHHPGHVVPKLDLTLSHQLPPFCNEHVGGRGHSKYGVSKTKSLCALSKFRDKRIIYHKCWTPCYHRNWLIIVARALRPSRLTNRGLLISLKPQFNLQLGAVGDIGVKWVKEIRSLQGP